MRRLGLAVLLLAGLATACAQAPAAPAVPRIVPPPATGPTAPATSATSATVRVEVTFYAGADNDPPGSSEIAHPNGRHQTAGGTGTWADPLTLATDPDELPVGTVVYVPRLQKYFVMEDDCEDCIAQWKRSRHGHVDLWISAATDPGVLDCEAALTRDDPETIQINPPADRTVDPRPLHDAASGACWPHT
ncbi:MAG: hypothetical protein AB7J32_13330 [Pseudonocardia sp.]